MLRRSGVILLVMQAADAAGPPLQELQQNATEVLADLEDNLGQYQAAVATLQPDTAAQINQVGLCVCTVGAVSRCFCSEGSQFWRKTQLDAQFIPWGNLPC
jgi:hypothetical protein